MARSLDLLDKNDPEERRVKNFAVLMFTNKPEQFIKNAHVELIADMLGSKRKMESKIFQGSIWKMYSAIVTYINDNYLDTIVVRDDHIAESRNVSNFTYVAVEELVANALVHNNYENEKAIQIYISPEQINIVNYNKPLPPLKISDLNERSFFNERNCENPELRDMFKALGIIESFGTGIGEAKRSLEDNGSPALFYKEFEPYANVTSVVIPVNAEYLQIKSGITPSKKLGIQVGIHTTKSKILASTYSETVKHKLILIYDHFNSSVFGNTDITQLLGCTDTTATAYIKRLGKELNVIKPVAGKGKGKFRFIND